MFGHFLKLFVPHHSNNQRPRVLHLGPLLSLISLFVVAQSGMAIVRKTAPDILGFASNIPPTSIVELTNQERSKLGLAALEIDEQLNDAARRKAADMFAKNYWAHVSPNGTKPWAFILAAGYSYLHAGENLAKGFTNSESIVAAWMASTTHRDNIVSSRYRHIGIAVVDGTLNGEETTLVVQMFGAPQSGVAQVNSGTTSIVRTAEAADAQPTPIPTPTLAPTWTVPTDTSVVAVNNQKQLPTYDGYWASKAISLAFAILVISVLIIDWLVAWRKNLVRLSGKSWAHLTFLAVILILTLIIKQGLIL